MLDYIRGIQSAKSDLGNSTAQTAQFLQQINFKGKKKDKGGTYGLKET